MEIRPIVPEDLPACMILITEFAEESLNEYGMGLGIVKLKEIFEAYYKTSFVAIIDGEIVGILGGRIIEDNCSHSPMYEEMIWFMTKKFRKYGMRLFKMVEQECREQKIPRLSMACMHNSQTKKLFSFYKRLGFKPMETRFIKELW